MNSYPPELVVQLAPVMFVAGLDVPPSPEPVPSSTSDPSLSRTAQDPFTVLTIRLRDALLSQRITAIWQPDKSKTFQTVLVDKVRSAVLAVYTFPIISQFLGYPLSSTQNPAFFRSTQSCAFTPLTTNSYLSVTS